MGNHPPEMLLRVRVTHGHLRGAKYPLAVGHYLGDGIVSAEADLDRQLDGRLSARLAMDLYPGAEGTADTILAPQANPPGALVVGLGEIGEITTEKVRRGVLEASLRHALARAESHDGQPGPASFSTLLIGACGGRAIPIRDSVAAIARAAVEANRVLARQSAFDRVRIEEIEFVELFEDAAIEAAHAAANLARLLANDLKPGEAIKFDGRLNSIAGGRLRRPANNYSTGWWRRIRIARAPGGILQFEALTDRARAEQSAVSCQPAIVEALLAEATAASSYDAETAVALFELLVPNVLKEHARETADLLLVLDRSAARYPWESMARRTGSEIVPLSVEAGMIRQLKLERYRRAPRSARDRNALVVGDTASGFPQLPGAQREGRAVADLFARYGYAASSLIHRAPSDIVRELFRADYRIVHLAGHGIYDPARPEASGMALADGVSLTAAEIEQIRGVPELVFVNCCQSGAIGEDTPPAAFAASFAEALIAIGVKAVIAAGWAVDDDAAVVFAETFYRNLLEGARFGASVKLARQAAYALHGDNNTWAAYQCYGDPDFALAEPGGAPPLNPPSLYARREYLDEFHDIAAADSADAAHRLREAAASLPAPWRDGEMLSAMAGAYECTGDTAAAIAAYREAIGQPDSTAPLAAIERLARLLESACVPAAPRGRMEG
jgi:CHAT domain